MQKVVENATSKRIWSHYGQMKAEKAKQPAISADTFTTSSVSSRLNNQGLLFFIPKYFF